MPHFWWCFVANFVTVGLVLTRVDPNGKPISSERLSPNGKKRRHHDSKECLEFGNLRMLSSVVYLFIYSSHLYGLHGSDWKDGISLFQSCILREGLVAQVSNLISNMNHRPDAHSLGAARVAELDQQSSQKVSTLWQRRCFSHEELNRYERLGWIGSRSSTKVVLWPGRPLGLLWLLPVQQGYDSVMRDETSWWSHDWFRNGRSGLSVWLAISEIWQRSLDSRAHPFHFSVHSEDFFRMNSWILENPVVKLRRVSRNVSNFRQKSSWVGADASPPSTYWPCGQIWWTGPPRALEASFGASGHAMDEDVGGDVGPEFETAYEVVGKRYRKWWKAGVVLRDLQISKVVDEKKHTHHIFLQVDGAKILEVTSVMLKWSMILIWWDDIIEICCCRCFILYSCLSIFCQGSLLWRSPVSGFFLTLTFISSWWNMICLIVGLIYAQKDSLFKVGWPLPIQGV